MTRRDIFKAFAGLIVAPIAVDIPVSSKVEPIVFHTYIQYISWIVQREIDFSIISDMLRIIDDSMSNELGISREHLEKIELREPIEGVDYIFAKDFKMEG